MNGSYDTVKEQLKDSYKRESKPVKILATGDEYDVLFRRSGNRNTTKNYGTIYYFKDKKELKQGRLLLFRNKYFLVMNQEEVENDVYYRSDIVQTNCVLESLINKSSSSGKWYADELVINAFSSDMKSNATINGSVITVLGGRFELMTEDNAYTRMISVDDVFCEFGGNYRVDGIYFLEGVAHVTLERTISSVPTRRAVLDVVQRDFYAEYEYSILDFVSPIVSEINGDASTDYIIRNASIDVVSSDESIAKFNQDTGFIETYREGDVTLTFTWIERDITAEGIFEIKPYEAPQSYAKITYSGSLVLKVGGSAKLMTCKIFDADDNEITDYTDFTFAWTHDMIAQQSSKATITYPAVNTCSVKIGSGDENIGTTFNLTVTVTNTVTGEVLTPDVVEIEIDSLF